MRTNKFVFSKSLVVLLMSGALVMTTASTGSAETMDEALRLYKSKSYSDAAFAFYDVLQNDPNPDNRDKAEIYLAETLFKRELYSN